MFNAIIEQFKQNQNPEYALKMKAYMKDNFEYFGIKSPLRKEITKPFFLKSRDLTKTELKILVKKLWQQPQRELHYFAQELAYYKLRTTKKETRLTVDDIEFFEFLATHNSWWDSIDFIAPKLMGDYFIEFPEQRSKYIGKWLASDNKWLIRCAILFQLKYKNQTDIELVYKTILESVGTNEFFINKAIGWVLRENSKRIPEEISSFVEFHSDILSNLSKKEALKVLNKLPN